MIDGVLSPHACIVQFILKKYVKRINVDIFKFAILFVCIFVAIQLLYLFHGTLERVLNYSIISTLKKFLGLAYLLFFTILNNNIVIVIIIRRRRLALGIRQIYLRSNL